jgi:CelD/BcsL family acetyltransferase involved in cellulose biosynthesis
VIGVGADGVGLWFGGYARVTKANAAGKLVVYESVEDFAGIAFAWNRLALGARSPFVTHEWVQAWWRAFGEKRGLVAALRGEDGCLVAGASLQRESPRLIRAAANEYSDDWDVVALGDPARMMLWRQLAALPGARVTLPGLPASSPSIDMATEALRTAGYRVAVTRHQLSPYIALPDSWEQLLAMLSQNLRSNVRRYKRRLEREGRVSFRTTTGPGLDSDLDRFFQLEASGWKGAAGTAVLDDPDALRLYRDFAHAAAGQGWLRLHLLELDGVTIAGGYSCVLGDAAFLLKSCFNERYARLAPGTILRSEAIRAAIGEGLSSYEFLGAPDPHKLRWGRDLRERLVLRAYRGSSLPAFVYRYKLRPAARKLRALAKPGTPASAPPGRSSPSKLS